jgi:hypothetical protein
MLHQDLAATCDVKTILELWDRVNFYDKLSEPRLGEVDAATCKAVVAAIARKGNQSVSLVHALGMALLMTADKDVIIKNAAGDAARGRRPAARLHGRGAELADPRPPRGPPRPPERARLHTARGRPPPRTPRRARPHKWWGSLLVLVAGDPPEPA